VRMSIAATIVVAVGLTFTARRVADNGALRSRMTDQKAVAATAPPAASKADAPAVADSLSTSNAAATAGKPKAPAGARSAVASAPAGVTGASEAVVSASSREPDTSRLKQRAALADKRAVIDDPRDVVAATTAPAAPPPAARLDARQVVAPAPAASPASPGARVDSLRAKDELAKGALDSASRGVAMERRQTAFAAGNTNQLREVSANERDADRAKVVVMRDCYRLGVDSTPWRGILPTAFALDAQASLQIAETRATGSVGGAAGSGAAPKTAPQSNSAIQLSSSVTPGNPVHALDSNGRVGPAVIGTWSSGGADFVAIRFATTDANKAITVVLSGLGTMTRVSSGERTLVARGLDSTARVMSGDRTDSVRVARTSCSR
jgi:hypothetical protein